jgi:hypothetical protein
VRVHAGERGTVGRPNHGEDERTNLVLNGLEVGATETRSPHLVPFGVSAVLAVASVVLYLWTVSLIRPFQPEYPGIVTLSLFTPPIPIHIAHSAFPVVFLLTSSVVAVIGVRRKRSHRPLKRSTYAGFIQHWVALGLFVGMFLWAALWAINAGHVFRSFTR